MSYLHNSRFPEYRALECLLSTLTNIRYTPKEVYGQPLGWTPLRKPLWIPLDHDDVGLHEESLRNLDLECIQLMFLSNVGGFPLFNSIGLLSDEDAARYGVKTLNALMRAILDPKETEIKSRMFYGLNHEFYVDGYRDPVNISFQWWYDVPELAEVGHVEFKI